MLKCINKGVKMSTYHLHSSLVLKTQKPTGVTQKKKKKKKAKEGKILLNIKTVMIGFRKRMESYWFDAGNWGMLLMFSFLILSKMEESGWEVGVMANRG